MSKSEFGVLILSHQSFLHQLAMKLTKSIEDANDLMQETLFKALKNSNKFKDGTNLKGWLYTIMKNTFINAYRKKKNSNTFVDGTDNNYFINLKEADRAEGSDSLVNHKHLMERINSVEKTYVDTFMMYFNGYKYEEIADIMGIPIGTVKSRIFLARKKMMSKLKDFR